MSIMPDPNDDRPRTLLECEADSSSEGSSDSDSDCSDRKRAAFYEREEEETARLFELLIGDDDEDEDKGGSVGPSPKKRRRTVHEFHTVLHQVAAARAPTEPAGANEDTSIDGVAGPPLRLPNTLKNLNAKTVFRNWYLKGYNRLLSDEAYIRSHVKFVVEYLNLFLDVHIPKMPENHQQLTQWRRMVEAKTEEVWKKAQDFAKENGGGNLLGTVSSFKKFMAGCEHKNLPKGPDPKDGECHFQPENEKLRTWEGLLRHTEEVRTKKRKAVP